MQLLIDSVTGKIYLFLFTFKQYYYLHLAIITFFIRIIFVILILCSLFLEPFFGTYPLLTMIPCWLFAVGIIWLWWQEEKVCKSFCWLIRALAWKSQPWQVWCSEQFCCFMYYMFCYCPLRKVSLCILIQDGGYRYTFVPLMSLRKSHF